jgi:hypothetical protein
MLFGDSVVPCVQAVYGFEAMDIATIRRMGSTVPSMSSITTLTSKSDMKRGQNDVIAF